MRYLLDTNMVIFAMKGVAPVRAVLEKIPLSDLALSPIVLGELQHGVEKSQYRENNRERLNHLLAGMTLLPLDADTCRYYGSIRTELERRGTPIGANDYWIAAQALAFGLVLATDNEREFSRVPGLELENWMGVGGHPPSG